MKPQPELLVGRVDHSAAIGREQARFAASLKQTTREAFAALDRQIVDQDPLPSWDDYASACADLWIKMWERRRIP